MTRTLGLVRHVIRVERNIISLSAPDSKGFMYIGRCGVLKVSKGAMVVLRGLRKT